MYLIYFNESGNTGNNLADVQQSVIDRDGIDGIDPLIYI